MYPVSQDYKNKIKENNRLFECKIQIEHSQGTLYLDDKDLVAGSLIYTESSQAGEEFTVGGTVASDISFTIVNKPEYENITFTGATVFVNIGLQIQEGIDAHFIQPTQPSKMQGFEEKWEFVPLGRFNIDDVNRQRNTIQLKAIDNMINLDKPYSLSKLSYPATLYQIYVNICNVADISVGTTNFPNKDYVVKVRPDDDLTLRDVLGYVAELAGCFAKCNRNGVLELRWYEPTDIELKPMNRFNFKPSDDTVQIKGIMATIEDKTYLAGTDDYAIDLSENPLLQGDYETVLPNILANVENTIFTPYTSDWQGNPAIQAGDMIKQIDRDGKEYDTLVTKSVYKYRGRSNLEAKGLPEISKGYKGSTNRKIREVRRVLEDKFSHQVNEMQKVIEDGMVVTYYQEEEPAGKLGDLWYDTTNELLKRYNGTQWALITDKRIVEAISAANDAQTTADGKIVSYYQDEMPTTGTVGDLWIDTNDGNKLYRYNGTTFILVRDAGIDEVATNLDNAITDVNKDISTLEQSVLNATEMIANMLGGYAFYEADAFYVADNPVLANAQKVWKWGIGGFGYSETGVEGPYTTGVSADGTIVAMLVAANIISADMVQTGILQSEDGSTWINLDNGEFNLKNSMSYIDETLHLTGAIQEGKVYGGVDINSETGIHVEFTEGGSATIGRDSILVENIDGSYTKIDGRGISRVLSIPVYEEVSTGTDLIDNFDSGDINDARINWNSNARSELSARASAAYQWVSKNDNMRSHVEVTTEDYYSSPYSAKISNLIPNGDRYDFAGIYDFDTVGGVSIPKFKYETWFHYGSRMSYWLENYTPTKNTTFSMRYKYIDCPNGDAYLNIHNITDSTTRTIYLTNNNWTEVTHQLIKNNVYRFSITLRLEKHLYFEDYDEKVNRSLSEYRPTSTNYLYIDDIVYETDLTGKVIFGYKDGEIPYDPFFHIGVIEPFTGMGKTVEIPEYFKGMDYKVYVFANGRAPNVPQVQATNNTIPNITFQGGSNQYSCNFIVVV